MGKNSLRKKIMLKGVTTTPDDYLCEDGELAGAMGVESTDGGVRSSKYNGPIKVMSFGNSAIRAVFVHKVKPTKNWILWSATAKNILWMMDGEDPSDGTNYKSIGPIGSLDLPMIEAIGNTLIVRCKEPDGEYRLHYILWKNNQETGKSEYKYLGTHVPDIEIRFGLSHSGKTAYDITEEGNAAFKVEDLTGFHVDDTGFHAAFRYGETDASNPVKITSVVRAAINKTLSEAQSDGFFVQPFLVRYALRMYNDRHIMCSAPVYMQVTDLDEYGGSPYCLIKEWDKTSVQFEVKYIASKLVYIITGENKRKLEDWEDIIKGVDVYVTPPIYTFKDEEITRTLGSTKGNNVKSYADIMKSHFVVGSNQGYVRMRSWRNKDETTQEIIDAFHILSAYDVFTGRIGPTSTRPQGSGTGDSPTQGTGGGVSNGGGGGSPEEPEENEQLPVEPGDDEETETRAFDGHFDHEQHPVAELSYNYAFDIGYKKKDEFYDEVRDSGVFRLLKSFDTKDIVADKLTWIETEKNILNNINVSGLLERDSYHDQDEIMAEYIYAYNKRINLGGVRRKLYSGFNPAIMLPYQTGTGDSFQMSISIFSEGQSSIVKSAVGHMPADQAFPYLFYPNTGATKIVIRRESDGKSKTFVTTQHTTLNGAVFFDGWARTADDFTELSEGLPDEKNTTIDVSEKLHTSESENPWIFEPTNINTIGNGRILSLGAVTTALSQGQHGDFPMYCFTSEGIYSLIVNKTGGWVTSQTVTRDVMMVKGSRILQIDDAIVFVSSQGLMMLQGDKTTTMTFENKDKQTTKVTKLPGMINLLNYNDLCNVRRLCGSDSPTDTMLDDTLTGEIMEYLRTEEVVMIYDYPNQRIVIGRPDRKYSYVTGLNKTKWSVAPWQLLNAVNSYPDNYSMLIDRNGAYHLVKLRSEADLYEEDNIDVGDDVLLLTRPMKLGEAADMLKELENVTVEGLYDRKKLGMAVWGTRDYRHWHLVGSCKGLHLVRKHGSGYRAFVVAILGRLAEDEYLDTITMEYQLRSTRKLHGMGYE